MFLYSGTIGDCLHQASKRNQLLRNRVLKVAKDFAVSDKDDFQHELSEVGLDYVAGDKPVVIANKNGQKYKMSGDFDMNTFREFLNVLKAGNLEPHIQSATGLPSDNHNLNMDSNGVPILPILLPR